MEASISPRQLARALGVSESSIKRWVDAGELVAQKTVGGHRRIQISEALRYIRRTRSAVQEPALLGLAATSHLQPLELQDELQALLLSGDERAAIALLLRSFVEGATLPDLIDGPIAASMREIGALWQHRSEGIFLEHRGTEICLRALYRLEALLPEPQPSPVAVGGAPSGDPYLLPSLSVATCLRAEGLHAVNLGAHLPAASFVDALHAHAAALVWISVSVDATRDIEQLLETVHTQARAAGSSVIVGGRAHAQLRNLDGLGIEHGNSMRELTAFARGLVAALRQRGRGDFTPP